MLVCPEPLPDELDRGYLGRAMRWNGVNGKDRFFQMVADWSKCSGKSRYEASQIELLSEVAHMEVSQFARLHTTMPLRRGIVYLKSNVPHGNPNERPLLWSSGIRLTRESAYFCKDCVKEDRWFHGHSYWRREHQIPGLHWCQKHKIPLNHVEGESAFFTSPSMQAHQCQTMPDALVKSALDNRYVRRYIDVCSGIMERDTPLNGRQVSRVLRARATELGFRTQVANESKPLLSDAAISVFGRPWLEEVLPLLSSKPEGAFLGQFDNVLSLDKVACRVYAYILASSVMYKSSEDALNALIYSPSPRPSSKPKKRATHNAEMIETYISQYGSYTKTASALMMSIRQANKRLSAMNLPNILEPVAPGTVRAVVAFFHEGLSLSDSAAKCGVDLETLEHLIRTPNAIKYGSGDPKISCPKESPTAITS